MRANRRAARIAAGCAGLSLAAAAMAGAQCTNPVLIPNQTISSGSVNFTDANALRADGVVINGGASVNFIAGNCINTKAGFRATAGTAGTTFHGWVQTAPAAVSVAPAAGAGLSQTFTWTASSPAGYVNLTEVYGRFATSAYEGANTCYIRYDRVNNLLWLADNGASYWMGGFAPGSGETVENSQCKVFGTGASVSGAGPQLAVAVPVEFKAGFSGTKNNYMFARDNIGQSSPWQQMGTWTVTGGQQYLLTAWVVPAGPPAGGTVGLNPAGGSYPSGTPVQVTAAPAAGYTFTGWSGDASGTANPLTVTMSANKTVTANFAQTPSQGPPYVSMDYPVSGMSVSGLVLIQGWAMDNLTSIETAINRVEVYIDGVFAGTATSGIRRDDLCQLYPNRPGCPIVGFRHAWNTLSHSNASHTIRLVAFDSDNPQKSSAVERSVLVNNTAAEIHLASPALVEMNLAAVPFDRYTYTDQGASEAPNCPAGVSVRTCYQAALWNYRAQGVTGVRVMFAFCGAGSTALSSCASGYQGVTVREEWKSRVNDFLSDVRESGIQRVALSPIFWGWNWPTSPPYTDFADTECSTGPVRLYWEPTVPFGHTLEGYNPDSSPIYHPFPGFGNNQGWNCSPRNPYFVGWQNLYNAIDAVLERAQSNSLIVSELNVQQELNLSGFTVLARFITDNMHGHTGNPDVFDSLRYYMGQRGFDWKRVTISVTEERASSPGADCSNGTIYGDSGRVFNVSALYAAIAGTEFGHPNNWDFQQYGQTGLTCGSSWDDVDEIGAVLPRGHAFPNVLDLHSYPCLKTSAGDSDCLPAQTAETLKNEAKANFNAVKAFLDSYGPGGAHGHEPDVFGSQFLLGETHSNRFQTEAQAQGQFTCENWPAIGPWGTVRGFNESSLAGRTPASVVRPWNYPNHACYLLPSPLGPYLPPQ